MLHVMISAASGDGLDGALKSINVSLHRETSHEAETNKTALATGVLCFLTALFLKVALGFFYLSVLTSSWQKALCWANMIMAVVVNLETIFYTLFHCGLPVSKFANRLVEGSCIALDEAEIAHTYVQGSVSILCDIILMVPAPVWARLEHADS
jgi:hypothetical protein